nr:isoform 2 of prkr-interacting protein 1 [Quercus suber]
MATSSTETSRKVFQRPLNKKRALSPTSQHSASINALFANPSREIRIPSPSTAVSRAAPAPPEIVANVQGSSAGAGSGEFHVYKASRRREYERLRVMDEETERGEKDAAHTAKVEQMRKADEEALERRRKKREKVKMRKQKGKTASDGGGEMVAQPALAKRKLVTPAMVVDGEVDPQEVQDDASTAAEEEVGIVIHDDD